MSRNVGHLMAALLGLFLAACVHGPNPPVPTSLAGTHWRLISIGDDQAPLEQLPAATVTFLADGTFYGGIACNSIGGSPRWEADGRFTPTGRESIMTTALCTGIHRSVAFGDRFWNGMREPRGWRRDGSRLVIELGNGETARLKRERPRRRRSLP